MQETAATSKSDLNIEKLQYKNLLQKFKINPKIYSEPVVRDKYDVSVSYYYKTSTERSRCHLCDVRGDSALHLITEPSFGNTLVLHTI